MGKTIDETGNRYGRLVVIGTHPQRKWGQVMWKCECDCGRESVVCGRDLRTGHTKSCGCSRYDNITNDISGQRFGRLLVVEPTDRRCAGSVVWRCKCDCGTIKYIRATSLQSGVVLSCGCFHSEELSNRLTTHGLSSTREYRLADAAKRRALKLNQTPDDANNDSILYMYKIRDSISAITGRQYHVDHIVPLSKGGPHAEYNLQILEGSRNLRKSNKVDTFIQGITLKMLQNVKKSIGGSAPE